MIAPYPLDLRTIISASKSRAQPAAFSMSQPRRGYAYVTATGTDTPVFWDVEFRFGINDSIRFQLWLTQTIRRGIDEFTMPIKTEFGQVTHTCLFLPDGLGDCRQDGKTFSYSAKIMARAQVIPQGYIDAAELIVALPNWNEWMLSLDIGISEMPTP